MSHTLSTGPAIVAPLDDLTLPQFIFGGTHPARPVVDTKAACLIDDETGRALSLDELECRTNLLSRAMKERWNIGDDDVVCISSPNHLDYPVICWATQQLGAIVATVNPSLTSPELVHQIDIVKPVVIFAHTSTIEVVRETINSQMQKIEVVLIGEQPGLTVDDLISAGLHSTVNLKKKQFHSGEARRRIAFLCFSSGTTGNPKAVAISHYNVIYNVTQIATFHRVNEQYTSWGELRFRPGDTRGGVLPFYHIYGLVVNLHFIIFASMRVVITAQFNFEKMLQNIVRYKITHLLIVPPQAMLLCKHPAVKSYDLSHVRFCMVAAAPLSAELTQDLLTIWPDIHLGQGYGMTETCAAVSMFPTTQKCGTLGSGGQLVSGTEAKIIKADGTLAKRGEPGEIWVKGDQVVLGYFNDEDATRATFVDGWVRTGDEALFAENGDLFVVDRIKEIMKVKGFQVSPSELEGQLLTHPDVSDVGVIGILDDYSGELPVAFVALTAVSAKRITGNQQAADTLKAELMKHVSDAKSRYKWLKAVHFVDAIPRNPSGKILRRVLRQQAQYVEREKVKL